jgi:hypothetical protein
MERGGVNLPGRNKMTQIEWRTKLSLLWIIAIFNFFSYLLTLYIETGSFGLVEQRDFVPIPIFIGIFCLMIWFTFILRPKLIRWPGIVIGVYVLLIRLSVFIDNLIGGIDGLPEEMPISIYFNETWGAIAAVLIIWHCWKLPAPDDDRQRS